MALVLASDWFSLLLTGKATADRLVAKGACGLKGKSHDRNRKAHDRNWK